MDGRRLNGMMAIVVGFLGLVGLAFWNMATLRYAGFPGENISRLAVSANPSEYPTGFADTVRARVADDPLDQKRFNAFYVFKASTAPNKLPPVIYQQLLGKLGWRDSPAQQNLLYAAALRQDYAALLQRSDALLRRGVATAQIFDVLYLLEGMPEWRDQIVARLAGNPQWRHQFFVNDHGYTGPDAIAARTQTLRRLRRTTARPTAEEVAPMVARMVESGADAEAYRIWLDVAGRPIGNGLLLDPDWHSAASQRWDDGDEEGSSTRHSPFAWQLNRGPGYDAVAEAVGRTALLRLRWDGNGIPTLLSQRFASPGRPLVVRITGPDAKPQLLSRLTITAKCDGQTTAFDRLIPTQGDVMTVAADGVPACAFPQLSVAPRVGGNDMGGLEIVISSINIFPR